QGVLSADGRVAAYIENRTEGRLSVRQVTTGQIFTASQDLDGSTSAYGARLTALSSNGRYLVVDEWDPDFLNWDTGLALLDLAKTCDPAFATKTGAGTILGGPASEVIHGSPGDDVINGGDGDDVVCGGGGNDTIVGGDGDDALYGQDGTD